jgi:hypothetical protein
MRLEICKFCNRNEIYVFGVRTIYGYFCTETCHKRYLEKKKVMKKEEVSNRFDILDL